MASGVTRLRLRTLLATMPNADGSRTRAEGFLLPWQGPYSRDLAMGVGDRPQDGVADNDNEPRQLSVTIRDVARAANVSISTVSHVLSGKRPTSGQTRRRVEDVVERLGYRPNRVAQSLVWRRPFALGLIIPDIMNPYFPTFARGVEDRVRERGYTLVLGNSDYDPRREESYLDLVRTRQLAGAIYCLGDELSPVMPQIVRAAEEGLAVVLVHSPMTNVPTVCADNRQGVRLAGQHLLELGHRQIGLISALPR